MDQRAAARALRTIAFGLGTVFFSVLFLTTHLTMAELISSAITGPVAAMVSLLVAAALLTTIHEAAHAIVGRLVGCEVLGVTVGNGPRLFVFEIGAAVIDVRRTLIGGATIAIPCARRSGAIAYALAGVGAEATVAAAMWSWHPDSRVLSTFRLVVIGVACFDVCFNLWPRTVRTELFGDAQTDGGNVLQMLRGDAPEPPNRAATVGQVRIVQAIHAGELSRAVDLARDLVAAHPEDAEAAAVLGTALITDERWREGFDVLAPVAGTTDPHPMVLNNAAWAAVMSFDPALLPLADEWSHRAITKRPKDPACRNTRGATLVMLDRTAEGLPLLEQVGAAKLSTKNRAFVAAFRALGEHARGSADRARELLAELDRLDPQCAARDAVVRRVWAPPAVVGAGSGGPGGPGGPGGWTHTDPLGNPVRRRS